MTEPTTPQPVHMIGGVVNTNTRVPGKRRQRMTRAGMMDIGQGLVQMDIPPRQKH